MLSNRISTPSTHYSSTLVTLTSVGNLPNTTKIKLVSPHQRSDLQWEAYSKKQASSENSTDISKNNDHHCDGHYNETKAQGNLVQLIVTIGHESVTVRYLYRNLLPNGATCSIEHNPVVWTDGSGRISILHSSARVGVCSQPAFTSGHCREQSKKPVSLKKNELGRKNLRSWPLNTTCTTD